jgi:hypothetical protein
MQAQGENEIKPQAYMHYYLEQALYEQQNILPRRRGTGLVQ